MLSAQSDWELRNVVVRLGGFHLLSFLGCIGFIMAGSGLKELLDVIYTPNSVDHILTGHMYSHVIREYFIVQLALAKVILKNENFTDEELDIVNEVFSDFHDNPPQKKTTRRMFNK